MGNNNTLEKTARNLVEKMILDCGYLDPYIYDNDRTPTWDGNVFVYRTKSKRKGELIGKVPIQIKGTSKGNPNKGMYSFSAEVEDLKNFNNDGGVVFILAIISNQRNQVYYASLMPFELNSILKKAKVQKNTTILLKQFPANNANEILNIFANFLYDKPKQMPFINKDLPTMQELEKQGVEIDCFESEISSYGSSIEIEKHLSTHGFYLYVKPKCWDVLIPVQYVENPVISRQVMGLVSINDVTYYHSYIVVHEQGVPTIKFGNSFSLTLPDDQTTRFNYALQGNLAERIYDSSFLLLLLTEKSLTINGAKFTLKKNEIDEITITSAEKINAKLKQLKLLLEELGVVETLDYAVLTKEDTQKINWLIDAIIYGRHIRFDSLTKPTHFGIIYIANLRIMLYSVMQEDGLYKTSNFFEDYQVMLSDTPNEKDSFEPASHYLLMDVEHFIQISNLDHEKVYKALTTSSCTQAYYNHVLHLLLRMISAYDKQTKKDENLFALMEKLCAWLSSVMAQSNSIMAINRIQISKRKRKLTDDEVFILNEILTNDKEHEILCGALILLGRFSDAKDQFKQLNKQQQLEFLKYPICNLCEELEFIKEENNVNG